MDDPCTEMHVCGVQFHWAAEQGQDPEEGRDGEARVTWVQVEL